MAVAPRRLGSSRRLGYRVGVCALAALLGAACGSSGGSGSEIAQGDTKGGGDSGSEVSVGDVASDLADSVGPQPDSQGADTTPDAIEKLDVGPAPTPGAFYPGEPYESACNAWCDRAVECLSEPDSEWKYCMYDCYSELESYRAYDSAACFALYTPIYTCTVALTCEDFVRTWGLDDSEEDPVSDACVDTIDAYDVCAEDDDGEGPYAPVPAPSTDATITAKLSSPYEAKCVATCDPQVRCPSDLYTAPTWLECMFDCMWEYEYASTEQDAACVTLLSDLDACVANLDCVQWLEYLDAPLDATDYPCATEYIAYDADCGAEIVHIQLDGAPRR
jgi:hypothetical protein